MNTSLDPNNKRLADLLFPHVSKSIADLRRMYPARNLSETACVTRVAPSPTGFMHIGGIYMALISRMIAHQSRGVFFLRIEDTDKKREVTGAKEVIVKSLEDFGLLPDEGLIATGEVGAYAPYTQSARLPIYHAFMKHLVANGLAYPCFATEDQISTIRAKQESEGLKPGYYGTWALWRNVSFDKIEMELQKKTPYVIRLKSSGKIDQEFKHNDLIKGELVLPLNTQDFVLLKSDGLPTYHLAHIVDDYLMGTTHVIRGDEWVSSLPLHYELWNSFGFPVPRYGHVPPIQKIGDSGGKRKLSKRHDPEASVVYYQQTGYPEPAVIDYLINLANSNYEDWRKENPYAPIDDFALSFDRFNKSGPLFDEPKLKDISRNIIARLDARAVYDHVIVWAKKFDAKFASLLTRYADYSTQIFGIERGEANARKDITSWSDVFNEFSYFFDENFEKPSLSKMESILDKTEISTFIGRYVDIYDSADDKDTWMDKIRSLAADYKLAPNIKTLKHNPDKYRGQVGEVTKLIRFALSGKQQTPDLYSMMKVMGNDRCIRRLKAFVL